jgi:alpha-1,3-glucosyltransferase
VLEAVIVLPARLPDLFPVLNVLLCTPIFGLVWLWSIKRGWEVQWALGGLGGGLLGGSRKTGLKSKGESEGETLKMTRVGNANGNGNVSGGAQVRL